VSKKEEFVENDLNSINEQELRKIRVTLLYNQSATTHTAGLLNVIIFIYTARNITPVEHLMAWGFLSFFIYAVRFVFQRWILTRYLTKASFKKYGNLETAFAMGTFLSGSMWGIAGAFLLHHGHIAHQAFLAFLLAGTTAGAAVAYCSSLKTIYAFLLPATIPFAVALGFEGGEFQYSMSFMLFLYTGFISVLMRRVHTSLMESIRLRFEKDRLLRELRETQKKITHSAKMAALGEMAGGIAHEVNTPLAIIQMEATDLKEIVQMNMLRKEDVFASTGRIQATVSKLEKIISGLIAFSRMGEQDPVKPVFVKDLVHQTLELCKSRFKNHGIALEIAPVPKDLSVNCRDVQLSQVLLNLLNNSFDAVQATKDPWVRLEAFASEDEITIAVTDSGPPIPEDIREKIMQPFFTTKELGKGTGLGLSISHGIAASHGGQLYLDASSIQTRFVLSIPKIISELKRITA
jgi:signal transduction histidine kinase